MSLEQQLIAEMATLSINVVRVTRYVDGYELERADEEELLRMLRECNRFITVPVPEHKIPF